jgi:fucose permease
MVLGYFIGVVLIPKVINQRQALVGCAVTGIALSAVAIAIPSGLAADFPFIDLGTFSTIQMHVPLTVLFVALLGLSNALVWPAIWPLALEGAGEHTKTGSALLIMAIAGGATLPLLYGRLAQACGTQYAYLIAIPCYLVILAFAIYCRKKK